MARTPLELVRLASEYLSEKSVPAPRLDAEVLLSHVLGVSRIHIYTQFDKPLQVDEVSAYREAIRRRAQREPVARITGEREFWSLPLGVDGRVLVPRPETERLVEVCLERMLPEGRFVDLGAGSGALALALLTDRPRWAGVGVDRAAGALEVAAANAERHGLASRLDLRLGDWYGPVEAERFDLIASNPPYIPSGDIPGLEPEVSRFDPWEALDGGPDGLDAVRRVVGGAAEHLEPGGWLALEFGAGQGVAVERLFAETPGFGTPEILADYAGHPRVAVARLGG